jgi:hypothetical protein
MYPTKIFNDLNLFQHFNVILSLLISTVTLSIIKDKIKEKTSGAASALHYGGGK